MSIRDNARLAGFFSQLAIKEQVRPGLHVRPLVAELFLTDNCNLRCISCNCWRENTKNELSTEEWKRVLRELAGERILKVNFTGGEPLIRPDAIRIMNYAHNLGFTRMHLNSNGLRLNPPTVQKVLDAGIRSFNISVDGPTGFVHDRIRGRLGAFSKTMDHLEHLISLRPEHKLAIRMNFTVMRDNIEHLPEMARLAQRLQVRLYLNLATDHTFLFRHEQVGGITEVSSAEIEAALGELEEIMRADPRWLPRYSDLAYMRGHFSDLAQTQLPCAESQLKLMIHSRGEIGGCWGHDPTMSVRERSIAEVIGSPQYRAEHEKFFVKDCVGCGSNYSLNLRWRPTSYSEDALWRAGRRALA